MSTVTHAFKRKVRRAGLREDLHFHSLRNYFCHLAGAGHSRICEPRNLLMMPFRRRHLEDDLAEGIEPGLLSVGPLVGGWTFSVQGGLDGVVTDAKQPGNLSATHFSVLRSERPDRYPIFHSNHLSSPLGQCERTREIQEATYS